MLCWYIFKCASAPRGYASRAIAIQNVMFTKNVVYFLNEIQI